MDRGIQPGIETLLNERDDLLSTGRWALLSHPAGVLSDGRSGAALLRERLGTRLVALFGPEHGFWGDAGPGEAVRHGRHPEWRVPIYSLYGDAWRGDAPWRGWDTLLFDVQDLGVRCYTYVSTLREVLEEAARRGKRVVVTDRPVPHVRTVDGPMLAAGCASFVGAVPTPFVYGMTPGETARWLVQALGLAVDLDVIPVRGYRRDASMRRVWPRWVTPSPAIRSWACALLYPVTVFTEALPRFDCARSTELAFQVIRGEGVDGVRLQEGLKEAALPGLRVARFRDRTSGQSDGVRLHVTQPGQFRPALTAITLLHLLQAQIGVKAMWRDAAVRPRFFDQLWGSPRPRRLLIAGASPAEIAATWEAGHRRFERTRAAALLYR